MSTTLPDGGAPRRDRRRRGNARANPAPLHLVPSAPANAELVDTVEATTFAELGVPAPIVAGLARLGCEAPLPIQAATLPSSLAGRDVLGRARTGSGKTVAFAVPVVAAMAASTRSRRPSMPRSLILVPTRELAAQVAATVAPLAKTLGQRVATVYGGVGQGPQVSALRQGVDVLVACPGRLEDLIGQGHCRLGAVEVCVLDEADHLADLGFMPAVKRLLDQTPSGGQRLLFSATLDHAVDALVRRYLDKPVTHSVDNTDAIPSTLEHHAFTVERSHKATVVRELASGQHRSLLFTRTKHAARKLAGDLTGRGVPAVELHGNLSQAQRDRNLAAFTRGSARVLVATDIAARGIHVDDIALVVHVDPPTEHKAYLHRSGRTARRGARGIVVTVVLDDQTRAVKSMIRQAGIQAATARIGPGDPRTAALTGPSAELEFRPQPAPVSPRRENRQPGTSRNARNRPTGARAPGRPPQRGSRRRPR